ncbi:hypothetical protein [Roseovarius sp. ZX-A-9]|uniref:hypothetical protein n=1 Tax=Roseovarius sp. ZX-A-9 TaxID=3014783 RepID=UPI00232C0BFC|nr:hypothetical protein [Roseovarius sp. ZX-A-9]
MNFLMLLNGLDIARHVCAIEGGEPFVDPEVISKAKRQGHMTSWKSQRTGEDATRFREAVPGAHLIALINPLHDGSAAKIDGVGAQGADSVMLPMFHDCQALERLLDLLGNNLTNLPGIRGGGRLRDRGRRYGQPGYRYPCAYACALAGSQSDMKRTLA